MTDEPQDTNEAEEFLEKELTRRERAKALLIRLWMSGDPGQDHGWSHE